MLRDVNERGRVLETILTQYTQTVKPSFEDFCLPVNNLGYNFPQSKTKLPLFLFQTKKYADVIIPRGAENDSKLEYA